MINIEVLFWKVCCNGSKQNQCLSQAIPIKNGRGAGRNIIKIVEGRECSKQIQWWWGGVGGENLIMEVKHTRFDCGGLRRQKIINIEARGLKLTCIEIVPVKMCLFIASYNQHSFASHENCLRYTLAR